MNPVVCVMETNSKKLGTLELDIVENSNQEPTTSLVSSFYIMQAIERLFTSVSIRLRRAHPCSYGGKL
jgi:hypothetical protein